MTVEYPHSHSVSHEIDCHCHVRTPIDAAIKAATQPPAPPATVAAITRDELVILQSLHEMLTIVIERIEQRMDGEA